MNYSALALTASILLLAGCGSGDDVSMKDASVEDVAKAISNVKPIKPGKWEATSEVVDFKLSGQEMNDPQAKAMMESMAKAMIGKKTTFSHCISPEEAAKPGEKFFAGEEAGKGCQYDNFSMTDGKIDAVMTCKNADPAGQGSMKMTMTGTYGETSYAMDATMVAEGMGPSGKSGGMTIRSKNSSKWVGACS